MPTYNLPKFERNIVNRKKLIFEKVTTHKTSYFFKVIN